MRLFTHPTLGSLRLGRAYSSPKDRKSMAKAFRMHDFLNSLPAPPDAFDGTAGITSWGMMENDTLGDCTCAACGHLIQAWTGNSPSGEVTVPNSAIVAEYEGACGYVLGDPVTDQGGIISEVLDYFMSKGVGGHTIKAYAEVNLTQLRVQQAISIFGAIDIGIEMPLSAQDQVGLEWDFDVSVGPDAKGAWGGHSVAVVKYDPTGLYCVTWGQIQKMSWKWFEWYCDEAYAIISPDYARLDGVNNLADDLNILGS